MIRLFFTFLILLFLQMPLASAAPNIEGIVTIVDQKGNIKEDKSGVIVFLDELEKPPALTLPKEKKVLTQRNKQFMPSVLPILVGTTVDFSNNDVVFHNVFSYSKIKPFDLGIYKEGETKSVTFNQTGLVKVYCNIHPQMAAYILVLANPYFSITDKNGHFIIQDVPEGETTVRTWYDRTRTYPEQRIRVTSEGNADVHFDIHEETISIEHKNKWGQDYPSKY